MMSKQKKDTVQTLRCHMCDRAEYEGNRFGCRRQTVIGIDE